MYLKDITKLMRCANKTARTLAAKHKWKPQGRGGYDVTEAEVKRVGALPREHYGNQKTIHSVHGSPLIVQVWAIKPMENSNAVKTRK